MSKNFDQMPGPRNSHEQVEKLNKTETIESQLSSETIEKIMEKVRDIDAMGTPYTRVTFIGSPKWAREMFRKLLLDADGEELNDLYNHRDQIIQDAIAQADEKGLEKLETVLKSGVLGFGKGTELKEEGQDRSVDQPAEVYVNQLKQKSTEPLMHFNIVGRTIKAGGMNPYRTEISQTYWMSEGAVAIVFDVSSYQEVPPDRELKLKQRTFRINDPRVCGIYRRLKEDMSSDTAPGLEELKNKMDRDNSKMVNSEGSLMSEEDYGFVFSSRIPPRVFRGIVINSDFGASDEIIVKIVSMMGGMYKDKQGLLLPIYDGQGNLLWPKKLGHEEVKNLYEAGNGSKKTL